LKKALKQVNSSDLLNNRLSQVYYSVSNIKDGILLKLDLWMAVEQQLMEVLHLVKMERISRK